MSERPVFKHNENIYVSAGIIIYTLNPESQVYSFMLQKCTRNTWLFEDLGGKSEIGDKNILDIAIRECQEELNYKGGINESFIRQQLNDKHSFEYAVPQNKYMLYMIYVSYEFKTSLNMKEFGTHENLDQIQREVVWLSYKDIMELSIHDIHPRFNTNDDFRLYLPLLLSNAWIKE
jgi:hypothetical protein